MLPLLKTLYSVEGSFTVTRQPFPVKPGNLLSAVSREEAVRQVKEAADIVEVVGEVVRLVRSGVNYKGLCPFHSEKTPSFTVNPQRRFFRCYGCGEGGDVLSFMMKYHAMSFPEALKALAQRYGVDLPEPKLTPRQKKRRDERSEVFAVNQLAAETFYRLLFAPEGAAAREHLARRGIGEDTARAWQLGFAPDSWDFLLSLCRKKGCADAAERAGLVVVREGGRRYDRFRNRLVFPVHDTAGRVIGFSGRILGEGEPKYLNTPETIVFDKGKNLFGLYKNREAIRREGTCLLVEGNFDLLSLAAAGIDNVAAPLGTSLTRDQVRRLKGYAREIVIFFDGDAAGGKAAMRAVPLCLGEGVAARVAVLPEGHDPDTLLRERGPEAVRELVAGAREMAEFVFDRLAAAHGMSVSGKTRIAAELKEMLRQADPEPAAAAIFASHFASRLGLAPEALMPGPAGPRRGSGDKGPPQAEGASLTLKTRQLVEFLIICPEYLQKFIKAGIEEVIQEERAARLIELLVRAAGAGDRDAVCDRMIEEAGPEEREYLTALLVAAPEYDHQAAEQTAAAMLAWLAREVHRRRQEELTRQIIEAQRAGAQARCLELMAQKRAMGRLPKTPPDPHPRKPHRNKV